MQPIAYFNGEFLPDSKLAIPVYDAGLVLGATVSEQVRTFAGRPFWLSRHLERFRRGLEIVGIDPPLSNTNLMRIALELIRHNHPLLPNGDDLGICFFATPGPYRAFSIIEKRPTMCVHTYPLAFELWASAYEQGRSGQVVGIRMIPDNCWPTEIKCRSRMHYFLATGAVLNEDPTATPILLDQQGFVAEAPIANIIIFDRAERLVSPPIETILPGISREYLRQLASRLGIDFVSRPLRVPDLYDAAEVLLTSSPFCILPMVRVNGRPIASGTPGAVFTRILEEWSTDVGFSISAQAIRRSGDKCRDP